jgi:hypothetical protein
MGDKLPVIEKPPPIKGKPGTKQHHDATMAKIREFAVMGASRDQIAMLMDIHPNTVAQYFREIRHMIVDEDEAAQVKRGLIRENIRNISRIASEHMVKDGVFRASVANVVLKTMDQWARLDGLNMDQAASVSDDMIQAVIEIITRALRRELLPDHPELHDRLLDAIATEFTAMRSGGAIIIEAEARPA